MPSADCQEPAHRPSVTNGCGASVLEARNVSGEESWGGA